MSNHWQLVCVDCDDAMPYGVNHGDVVLSELVTHTPSFAAFCDVLALFDFRSVTFQSPKSGCVADVDLAWLIRHAAHRLVVRSEYGMLATQCGHWKHANERKLGDSSFCTLDKDHDGDHDYTPRKPSPTKDVP